MCGVSFTRRSLALALLGCMMVPLDGRAADEDLARLFSELGTRGDRQARFTERRFSALLKGPAESSGTLGFRAPDVLEKNTVLPQRESVRVEGNVVTYESAARASAQKRTFSLSDAPLLAALIESLRATLAGDLAALRSHYDVQLSALTAMDWQLTLTPRDRMLRDAVAKVVLRGSAGDVRTIEIVEANGDLVLTQITPLPAPAAPAKK
ncbi:MAG: LolA-related protein [Burkholderiaceae bacterium]